MSDTALAVQDHSESPHPDEQASAENQTKRRYIRHVMRQHSLEEKAGLLRKFDDLVKSGVDEQLTLARLGLTYDTIYQWRDELEAKQQREKQFENQQTEPIISEKTPKEIEEIPAQEKNMAKTGKKAKVRKAKTTKVVKQKKKDEPDLKAKVKPGPTLPTKGPKATKSKVEKPKAKTTKAKATKASKKGKRYSAQEKKDILAKYNSLRDSGTNAYDAAEKVGISYITIRSWEKKEGLGRRTKGAGGTKPAQTRSASTGGLSMVLPNGNRIEGLTLEQVIKIAKNT